MLSLPALSGLRNGRNQSLFASIGAVVVGVANLERALQVSAHSLVCSASLASSFAREQGTRLRMVAEGQ